jgi:hypothetical protein
MLKLHVPYMLEIKAISSLLFRGAGEPLVSKNGGTEQGNRQQKMAQAYMYLRFLSFLLKGQELSA